MERLAPRETNVSPPTPTTEPSDHSLLLRLRGGQQVSSLRLGIGPDRILSNRSD